VVPTTIQEALDDVAEAIRGTTSISVNAGGNITVSATNLKGSILQLTGTLPNFTTLILDAAFIDGGLFGIDTSGVNFNGQELNFEINTLIWGTTVSTANGNTDSIFMFGVGGGGSTMRLYGVRMQR